MTVIKRKVREEHMNRKPRYTLLALLLAVTANIALAGCQSSEPPPIPIGKRPPGQDITPEDRADKRGTVK